MRAMVAWWLSRTCGYCESVFSPVDKRTLLLVSGSCGTYVQYLRVGTAPIARRTYMYLQIVADFKLVLSVTSDGQLIESKPVCLIHQRKDGRSKHISFATPLPLCPDHLVCARFLAN